MFKLAFLHYFIVRSRLINTVSHENNDLAIVARGAGRLHGGYVGYTYMYNYTEVVF